MFRSFFLNKKWLIWAYLGSVIIFGGTWYQVHLDVQINEWFGGFYDIIQKALTEPNSVTFEEYMSHCLSFAKIAGIYVIVAVILEFIMRHYVFRWRTAMHEYYVSYWPVLRHIEGASQRIQEDTMRFARIMESLGVTILRSVMTLFAFLPILAGLSENIPEIPMPWGPVQLDYSMVYVAVLSAVFGTILLAIVGIKLPGLEFNNQKVEAAYRKELVLGEDYEDRSHPPSINELFRNVRKNYFLLFKHYLYFDIAKWSYLQFSVILPYMAVGLSVVSAAFTLGVMQQIIRAFNRVENSFQILVHSWSTLVELMSIYKRLHQLEKVIKDKEPPWTCEV